MKNNNEINNIMKAVELEMELKKVSQRIETTLFLNEAWMDFIDKKYEDKLRDLKLVKKAQDKMIKCHNDYCDIVQPKDKFIDDTQCLIIYDCFGVEERHFVIIEEKDVED